MVAGIFVLLLEITPVRTERKVFLNVGALVTMVATVHYFYMREFALL